MSSEVLELQLDLSAHGGARVIEARLPRSAFGRLSVGDVVMVVDDSVEQRLYLVAELSNGDRDVRLLAVDPVSAAADRPAGTDGADRA
ncbi:hypothetical protein [Aeromicrobium fastidiosum]|uniref:Uncharacterized protein n=1 Tax=Aeromicrobium fastidiosum TaxID=52699 RepID=A0A641AKQ0_9ACTN|nr:hypothetical protein [Aeromicrobium fastidiosum]KAA1376395.1 hypothetical protein ESP62_013270 [Aeromicrobium fastidiosum]MBP2391697.1 hypothetical protein [Aeromicrobium fastidiosum]